MNNEFNLPIAIAVIKDNKIANIIEFKDNKKKVIKLLNEIYRDLYVRTLFDNAIVKFNIGYLNENELYDIDNWFTIDDLEKANIFVLKDGEINAEVES